ncbi:WWE domain protein [Necator americanus]|uniref:E3 ubiquitin-protein ligase n=1 Tax=Necator americanus TaxID=51031 RepID=W2T546_NECAM|nr:WWE domain protein [Necator americanus]ETN76724.1 WWE domain protein [Necator americanus]
MPVDDNDDEECPVCYQKMILPTTVPACGHRFCFLCIKAVVIIAQSADTALFVRTGPKRVNAAGDDGAPSSKKTKEKKIDGESPVEGPSIVQTDSGEEDKGEPDSEPQQVVQQRFYWLYKGRDGWWRFDPRLEKDIEAGRAVTPESTEIIICGYTYVLDFDQMVQYRKEFPRKTREIKFVSALSSKFICAAFVTSSL